MLILLIHGATPPLPHAIYSVMLNKKNRNNRPGLVMDQVVILQPVSQASALGPCGIRDNAGTGVAKGTTALWPIRSQYYSTTLMHCITTFRSTTDRINDGGPIIQGEA